MHSKISELNIRYFKIKGYLKQKNNKKQATRKEWYNMNKYRKALLTFRVENNEEVADVLEQIAKQVRNGNHFVFEPSYDLYIKTYTTDSLGRPKPLPTVPGTKKSDKVPSTYEAKKIFDFIGGIINDK